MYFGLNISEESQKLLSICDSNRQNNNLSLYYMEANRDIINIVFP